MASDGAGLPTTTGAATLTQLGYLASVISDIQAQINALWSAYSTRAAAGALTVAASGPGSHSHTQS